MGGKECIMIYSVFFTVSEITLAFVASTYVVVATAFLKRIQQRKENLRNERDKEFLDVFMKGVSQKNINNLGDVYNIYKGIYKHEAEDESFRKNINNLLKQLLVIVIKENDGDGNTEQTLLLKTKIDEFIRENEKTSPFAELPTSERNLLTDILGFLEKNDNVSIQRKVSELSNLIQIRNEQIYKLEKLNKWSMPLAVIGLILTIIFGVLSFFKG